MKKKKKRKQMHFPCEESYNLLITPRSVTNLDPNQDPITRQNLYQICPCIGRRGLYMTSSNLHNETNIRRRCNIMCVQILVANDRIWCQISHNLTDKLHSLFVEKILIMISNPLKEWLEQALKMKISVRFMMLRYFFARCLGLT